MGWPRISLAGTMAFIVIVSVGFAGIARPSSLAASGLFSLYLTSVTIAALGALYRTGRARAFWTGFVACGLLYMLLAEAPWLHERAGACLITTALLDIVYPRVMPLDSGSPADPWDAWTGLPPDYSRGHERAGMTVNTTEAFLLIGHSLFAMVVAWGGGMVASRFFTTHHRQ